MIKYSYSVNVICSICEKQIEPNSPIIVYSSQVTIGFLEPMRDIDDNADPWGVPRGAWEPFKTAIGQPFISYDIPGENLLYRNIDWSKAITFPTIYTKEIQERLLNFTSKLSNCEAHLECYEENLHKINQIFNMKNFA